MCTPSKVCLLFWISPGKIASMLASDQTRPYANLPQNSSLLFLALIIFIGFGLRIYNLRQDSRWFDEIRVTYFFHRLAGKWAALVSVFLLALNPIHVYYSQ
jgi:predicted membrane-bound mannosyltransferase